MSDKTTENSEVYKAVNLERLDFGLTQQQVSKEIGHGTSDGNVWRKLRSGDLKFNVLSKICNACGLELLIRNPRKNCTYLLNKPKSKK